MIASNRISAFDVILPKPIPYKGQVLNQIAAYMLECNKRYLPKLVNEIHLHQCAMGIKCIPFKVEMVVRGNLTGHAWRTYHQVKEFYVELKLPDGLKENDYFPEPIITPSTKADEGHDEDISKEEIIKKRNCIRRQIMK